jgi:uncharacterized membrane protein (DUF485 family)
MKEEAMPNELNPNDPRNLWQDQEVERVTITVDDVRSRAARFERRVHWRNLREYAAGAIVVASLSPHLWRENGWRLAPALLLIAGTIYVMFQIYRRGSARPVPAEAGMTASLEFHRRELERQRDALRTVWAWYLLPFLPGFVAMVVATAMDRGINARLIVSGLVFVLVFVVVGCLNAWAARKLDRKIQEVKAWEAKDE